MQTTPTSAKPPLKSIRRICLSDSLDFDGRGNFRYEADNFPVWIVSDCRRETDLRYFSEQFGDRVKRVRIVADDKVRTERWENSICVFAEINLCFLKNQFVFLQKSIFFFLRN